MLYDWGVAMFIYLVMYFAGEFSSLYIYCSFLIGEGVLKGGDEIVVLDVVPIYFS